MRFGTIHKKKKYFFNKIKIEFLSLIARGKKKSTHNESIKSCLLIHNNGKLGDLIVLSSLYRELTLQGVSLSVLTSPGGNSFLASNPGIKYFFIKDSNKLSDALDLYRELRSQQFDIVLDPFETRPSFVHTVLLYACRSSYILGFDKWYKSYYSHYHQHDTNLTEHISSRAGEILSEIFRKPAEDFDLRYDISLPEQVELEVKNFVGSAKIIIINPLGAKKICRLTDEQIEIIYSSIRKKLPDYKIIFTGLPKDLEGIKIHNHNIETLPFNSFMHTIALTKYSSLVISVDTALIHIASAYKITTLGLYPFARRLSYPSHLIWAPNNPRAIQVVSPTFTVKDITTETLTSAVNEICQKLSGE